MEKNFAASVIGRSATDSSVVLSMTLEASRFSVECLNMFCGAIVLLVMNLARY